MVGVLPQPAERPSFIDRVGSRASTISIVRLLLGLLALPFYAVGMVIAVLWLALRWVIAAGQEGFADGTVRAMGRQHRRQDEG